MNVVLRIVVSNPLLQILLITLLVFALYIDLFTSQVKMTLHVFFQTQTTSNRGISSFQPDELIYCGSVYRPGSEYERDWLLESKLIG